MISIKENSKIYILCPAHHQTGGTELAHQLVDYLIGEKMDAFIVYIDNNYKVINANIPAGFKKYTINKTVDVIDSFENIIVLPEVSFSFANQFNKTQFVFWWMSVDNFYTNSTFWEYFCFLGYYDAFKLIYSRFLDKKSIFNGFSFKKLANIKNDKLHVYQSTYAKNFLIQKKISDILPLSDYINSIFFKENYKQDKQDIILYNPAKGLEVTKKIMKLMPDYKFVPLVNLSRSELSDLFQKSKIYIDFGNHPGKDRLPREAALYNCCVIVGKNGAASFFEDISILEKYKFNRNEVNKIVAAIEETLLNYDDVIEEFSFYRRRILSEKKMFHSEINDIFNINK